MKSLIQILGIFAIVVTLIMGARVASAQSTEFSYQGELTSGGNPASGNYDFELRLYDALSGGTQLGATLTKSNVPVANGTFTVMLDFGDQFPGAVRYIQIGVRSSGGGAFTTLLPRQAIGSAPYAIKSLTAQTATSATTATTATSATTATNALQLGGVVASQYVLTSDSRLSDARNPLPGSSNYIRNSALPQASSNFNISGDGFANRFSAATQYDIAGGRILASPGANNLFLGFLTGDNGSSNTFVGSVAGSTNISGESNSFFGDNAGANITFGNNNSFFGSHAGRSNQQASNNSFFGASAGFSLTTGFPNSFFGMSAGFNTTTGNLNSFFGFEAGKANVNAQANSFFGDQAGLSSTAGGNSFFGASSGRSNVAGTSNSFFGRSAGHSNVSGSRNTYLGFLAGQSIEGNGNTIVGHQAGASISSGNNNAIFGANAGLSQFGSFSGNSFFGTASGKDSTTGFLNSFFGLNAGTVNTTGFENSFFGTAAGSSTTTGSNNAFFGTFAGDTNNSGTSNSALGAYADVGSSNLTYATAIGASATVVSSNTVQLGRRTGDDAVIVSGTLRIGNLGAAGSTTLCRNASFEVATCSSSLRYKSQVKNFRPGLAIVRKLHPVSFNWTDGGALDMGLVAEEVAEVEPLLTTTIDGKIEGVKYDRVGVVLVNAVNEQQAQIEGLTDKLKREKEKSEALAVHLKALETILCELKPEAVVCKHN